MRRKTLIWLSVANSLLAIAIFAIDVLVLPVGVAAAVPYVAVVLISLWLPRRQHVLYVALAVSVLTVLGYFWSSPAGVSWIVLANRFLALFAIWVIAMIGYQRKRTEDTLRVRDRVLAATGNGIVITDPCQPDNPIVYCNTEYERLSGYSRDEVVGRNCRFMQNDDGDQEGLKEIRAAIKEVRVARAVIRNYRKDGSLFWNELTISPVHDEDGRLTHFVAIQDDVTAHKQAEEALRESEKQSQQRLAQLQAIYSSAPIGLCFTDTQHRFVNINKQLAEINGRPMEDHIGRTLREILPSPLVDTIEDHYERVLRTGKPELDIELRGSTAAHPDTNSYWLVGYSPVRNGSGAIFGVNTVVQDITNSKRDEEELKILNETLEQRVAERTEALRESGRRYSEAAQIARLGHWNYDFAKDAIIWSKETYVLFGIDPSRFDINFEDALEYIHPDDRQAFKYAITASIESGEQLDVECRIIHHDRRDRFVHWLAKVRRDGASEVVGLTGVLHDITEQKQAEDALKRSASDFRMLADNVPALFSYVDVDQRYRYVNSRYGKMFGLPPTEIVGKHVREIVGEECYKVIENKISEVLAGNQVTYEAWLPFGNIGKRWVTVRYVPDLDDQNQVKGFFTLLSDITALRVSEERLHTIMDTSADCIITIDKHGKIVSVNAAAEQMFGYTSDEMIDQHIKLLMPLHDHDKYDSMFAAYQEKDTLRKISIMRDVTALRKDGSTIPLDIAVSKVNHTGLFTCIIHDISERKNLQRDVLHIAEDEQRRIGHDLHDSTQQELVGLSMLAQTLLENLSEEPNNTDTTQAPRLRELATIIVKGLARTSQDIRAISRGLVPYKIDITGLCDALIEFASRTDDLEGVTCEFECEQPFEVADRMTATHLYRIVEEATANALKHGHPKHILIKLESNDGQIVLQITDDGTGINLKHNKEGMGMKTMLYRASLIGAILTVKPIKAGGTRVTCRIR